MKPHFQKLLLALIVFISPDLLAQNSDSLKSGTKHSRFSIGGGINYSNKGYQYDLSGFKFGDMIDPRFGFIYQTQSVEDIADSGFHLCRHFNTYLQVYGNNLPMSIS